MKKERDILCESINKEIESLGLTLIDVKLNRGRSSASVTAFVYKEDGVKIEDCEKVYNAIFTKLQVEIGDKNLFLEISSPGLERELEYFDEFKIFKGRMCKILCEGKNPIEGIISSVFEDGVKISTKNGSEDIKFIEINRAKLVFKDKGVERDKGTSRNDKKL